MIKSMIVIITSFLLCVGLTADVAYTYVDGITAETVDVLVDAEELEDTNLKNARRTATGILMMGIREDASHRQADAIAQELWDEGIRVVLSLHPPDDDIVDAMRDIGITLLHDGYETRYESYWNFHWWLGYDEPMFDAINDMVTSFPPEQIAIHCHHGVDRAGNTMAYILSVYYDVPIEDAWYAVVDPYHSATSGLADVLEEYGIYDRRTRGDEGVAIYAFEESQGMKAHTSGFRDYIRNTINAAIERGASFGPEHLTE